MMNAWRSGQRVQCLIHALLFCVLAGAGAYLRLHNLPDNPAWYTDETTHIEIARHLMRGDVRYFAVQDSWLLFSRLPLFEYLLAGVFQIAGVSIAALRTLTAFCGVLTGCLLYGVLQRIQPDRWLSLLACGVWFVLPEAVLYNRFGFSYNLLPPLIVLLLWSVYRYRKTADFRWLLPGILCVATGTLSDVVMWSFLPLLLLIPVGVRLRDALLAPVLASAPLLLYLGWQFLQHPDALTFDLAYLLARTAGQSLTDQFHLLIENYLTLLNNPRWLVALIGLFLLRDRTLQIAAGLLCLPLLLLARTVPLYHLSAYYVLPFLPLVACGIASFLLSAGRTLTRRYGRLPGYLLSVLLIVPVLMTTLQTVQDVRQGYQTAIDPFLIAPEDARLAAGYVNTQANPDDTVIVSAPVGWLINREMQVVEFQMAAIAQGEDAVHIPGDLPPARLLFPVDYRQADYIVIDNLWRNWGAVHIPQIARLVQHLETQEPVFASGNIEVFQASFALD